jgi:hypothetical protein
VRDEIGAKIRQEFPMLRPPSSEMCLRREVGGIASYSFALTN